MLPITYPAWEGKQSLCPDHAGGKHFSVGGRRVCCTRQQAIRQSAQWLIERLYEPCPVSRHPWGTVVNNPNELTKPYDVDRESIKWGDLSVVDVRRLGKSGWLVEIEEASPTCAAFCGYIQSWLTKWGWENVEVRTEW